MQEFCLTDKLIVPVQDPCDEGFDISMQLEKDSLASQTVVPETNEDYQEKILSKYNTSWKRHARNNTNPTINNPTLCPKIKMKASADGSRPVDGVTTGPKKPRHNPNKPTYFFLFGNG